MIAARPALSARFTGCCTGAHHRSNEFYRPGFFARPRQGRAAGERVIGKVSEFDFRALQSGAIAEVPPPIPDEPAISATLPRTQSKLPSGAGQIANILTRMGQPQKGLDQILETIRTATPNDPTLGYWYLFAAEAELELGHDRVALDWGLRANAFMPVSPLVQAWLASIYTAIGDKSNAAKYVAALTKMAPG